MSNATLKFTLSLMLALVLAFTAPAFAQSNRPPKSLREAVQAAIKLNNKTVSTDQFLDSLHYSTLASKASMLPSGAVSCGRTWTSSSVRFVHQEEVESRGATNSCSVSVSAVIFDNRAGYYRYKSVKASEEATAAAYNTTDSLMTNTRGGLASSTMLSYMQLAQYRTFVEKIDYCLEVLREFQKFSNEDALTSMIVDTQSDRQQFVDQLSVAKDSFEHAVTLPAADDIEELDAAIASLKIPVSAEDAVAIALEKGPEIRRRNLNVQMAEFSLKAAKAELGPVVSIQANLYRGRNSDFIEPGLDYRSRSNSIGVVVSIPLGVSQVYSVKAAKKNLDSKISEKKAAIDDATYTINSTYRTLQNQRRQYVTMSKNYDDQVAIVNAIVERVRSGKTEGLDIMKMIRAVGTLENRYILLVQTQTQMLQALFSVQQVTGLLFSDFSVSDKTVYGPHVRD